MGSLTYLPPPAVTTDIRTQPFEGMRWGIAKSDQRSQDGKRLMFFCATDTERDALLASIEMLKGKREVKSYWVIEFEQPRAAQAGA